MPSSSSVAQTSSGARSANRPPVQRLAGSLRSAGPAPAAGPGRGADRRQPRAAGLIRCRRYQVACGTPAHGTPPGCRSSVPAGRSPHPSRLTLLCVRALGDRLQERLQFDCTSTTKPALASSCSSLAFSFCSRAICASRGSARRAPRGCFSPASARASRAPPPLGNEAASTGLPGAGSRPSHRRAPPRKRPDVCLYCAVNVRRAFSGTSGSGRSCSPVTRPASPTTGVRSSTVIVI